MNDPLVRLSEVIEVVLKSKKYQGEESTDEFISSDDLISALLSHFKADLPIQGPKQGSKPPSEFN